MAESTKKRPPPPPSGKERRRHERLELLAQIEVRGGDTVWLCRTLNISAGGVYVETRPGELPEVQPGDVLTVYLDLSGPDMEEGIDITAKAEVVRVDTARPGQSAGVALMWTSFEPELAERLARLLRHLSAR